MFLSPVISTHTTAALSLCLSCVCYQLLSISLLCVTPWLVSAVTRLRSTLSCPLIWSSITPYKSIMHAILKQCRRSAKLTHAQR